MDMINWLLTGDASIKYMVSRDLLKEDKAVCEKLRQEIHKSGWCKRLVDLWDAETKMWGRGIYSPKWISTTYTMLDLKNFCIHPDVECYRPSANLLIDRLWVNYKPKNEFPLDFCICGMLLNLCCYAKIENSAVNEIVDTLLDYHMADGAWNCDLAHKPHHSSLHTTINVLEGFLEYEQNGYEYRLSDIKEKVDKAHEFILCHRLYKSDKTGQVIKKSFTMLSYPSRWRYDILRALDYFRNCKVKYDERMSDALDIIKKKRRKDSTWPIQQKYPGVVHFDYEETGSPSRINTLRALRVLDYYDI